LQISIYLAGIPKGSIVKAMIFANEPKANLPKEGEPIAQSIETLNVTSTKRQWYNFTMNYPASMDTTYWLGYYSDCPTHYFFDPGNGFITVTSLPEDGTIGWFPVGWSYQTNSVMSIYALYAFKNPQPTTTPVRLSAALSPMDVLLLLLIMGAESAIVAVYRWRKKNA